MFDLTKQKKEAKAVSSVSFINQTLTIYIREALRFIKTRGEGEK